MLVPMPLSQRLQGATLLVEARVLSQQAERGVGRHIFTRHTLEVFKVFTGILPTGTLSVRTAGGTLGPEQEKVSSSPTILTGMQGVFLLEADPTQPGEWRLYAGPQGFIHYDLATLSASEPFGRYANIGAALYPALAAGRGTPYRELRPNADLLAATARTTRRTAVGPLTVTPTISSFSPATVTAGTATTTTTSADGVLTIVGTGFGATQGQGFVQFRNADAPGSDAAPNFTQPLPSDYLSWSDTQIQVRVPSYSQTGNAVGTGQFQVTDDGGNSTTSATALTVMYALATTILNDQTYRPHLISQDGKGGYTLHYSPSFPAAAQAPFERALTNWRYEAGVNRTVGAPTSVDAISADGVSAVLFSADLGANVLGATYSYSTYCSDASNPPSFQVVESDYAFATTPVAGYTWHYSTDASVNRTEYDFESIALHEQGHGAQLTHIISPMGVMNFSIANGEAKRTLDYPTDIAAARDVINYSVGATATDLCNNYYQAYNTSSTPLPVVLTAFAARYQPGQGTRLSWATASEAGSLAFVVESQDDLAASAWQEVARVAAAGTSPTPRQYASLDARPLAGTRYYRLRQVDLDGRVAYSPVAAVTAATAAELAAYPNPAARLVHLSGPLATGAPAQVRLLDATGRCVASATGPMGQAAFDLPLAGVPAGLYVVEWDGGAGRGHLRLVVQ
ncbi:hypothetical protein A8B98_13030 [Hymenobacter sp. UV11]|nr:hypothetical protein A8B98_13030 [Hymenobacter sp. UV11]